MQTLNRNTNKNFPFLRWGILFLLLCPLIGFAQSSPNVSVDVDTLSIKIGEQIQYAITVEADSLDVVHFPEGQTFSPLETVEAIMADTIKNNEKVILQKIYQTFHCRNVDLYVLTDAKCDFDGALFL